MMITPRTSELHYDKLLRPISRVGGHSTQPDNIRNEMGHGEQVPGALCRGRGREVSGLNDRHGGDNGGNGLTHEPVTKTISIVSFVGDNSLCDQIENKGKSSARSRSGPSYTPIQSLGRDWFRLHITFSMPESGALRSERSQESQGACASCRQ